jgi:hypothetical protein
MEYLRCGVIEYLDKPMYPSKAPLEKYRLKAQGKNWGRYDD